MRAYHCAYDSISHYMIIELLLRTVYTHNIHVPVKVANFMYKQLCIGALYTYIHRVNAWQRPYAAKSSLNYAENLLEMR
jgi:hypothetical protein